MDKKIWGVHASHCCVLHGCKYGDEDCPVVEGLVEQKYTCESCDFNGIESVEEVNEYVDITQKIKKAQEEGVEELTVSVKMLNKLLRM